MNTYRSNAHVGVLMCLCLCIGGGLRGEKVNWDSINAELLMVCKNNNVSISANASSSIGTTELYEIVKRHGEDSVPVLLWVVKNYVARDCKVVAVGLLEGLGTEEAVAGMRDIAVSAKDTEVSALVSRKLYRMRHQIATEFSEKRIEEAKASGDYMTYLVAMRGAEARMSKHDDYNKKGPNEAYRKRIIEDMGPNSLDSIRLVAAGDLVTNVFVRFDGDLVPPLIACLRIKTSDKRLEEWRRWVAKNLLLITLNDFGKIQDLEKFDEEDLVVDPKMWTKWWNEVNGDFNILEANRTILRDRPELISISLENLRHMGRINDPFIVEHVVNLAMSDKSISRMRVLSLFKRFKSSKVLSGYICQFEDRKFRPLLCRDSAYALRDLTGIWPSEVTFKKYVELYREVLHEEMKALTPELAAGWRKWYEANSDHLVWSEETQRFVVKQ